MRREGVVPPCLAFLFLDPVIVSLWRKGEEEKKQTNDEVREPLDEVFRVSRFARYALSWGFFVTLQQQQVHFISKFE